MARPTRNTGRCPCSGAEAGSVYDEDREGQCVPSHDQLEERTVGAACRLRSMDGPATAVMLPSNEAIPCPVSKIQLRNSPRTLIPGQVLR